ncbi:MAG: hypothetical protein JXA57_06595 [Armatimonadetes bacterium]|nr:hypothetical protein [Armatimonadota bacterium]
MINEVPRLFESFDGQEPGTQERSDDITGMPLRPGIPPLQAEYPDSNVAYQTGHSPSTGGEPGLPDQRTAGRADEPYDPEVDQRSRNRIPARQRIAQLTQKYRQSENQNSELMARIESLQESLRAQEAKINSVTRTPTQPSDDSYAGAISQGGVDLDSIRRIVQEAVTPLSQRLDGNDRMTQLKAAQDRSFYEALKELPSLKNQESEEAEIFRELWATSPLQSHPDGPLHVAFQVKGVLAEDRAYQPEQEARKRAANVVRPGPTPGMPAPSGALREKQKIYEQAMQRVKEGSATTDDYIVARKIRRDMDPQFPRRR